MASSGTDVQRNYSTLAPQRSSKDAASSDRTFCVRRANNLCKAYAIERAASLAGMRCVNEWCMDLGCGRGGDLKKFEMAGMWQVMCVDVVDAQLGDMARRVREMRSSCSLSPQFRALPIVADLSDWCGRLSLLHIVRVTKPTPVAVVTAHFSAHYFARTLGDLVHFMRVMQSTLRAGGVLSMILSSWEDVEVRGVEWTWSSSSATSGSDAPLPLARAHSSPAAEGGSGYSPVRFTLQGSVEGVEEQNIPLADLCGAAAACGFSVRVCERLDQVWDREVKSWSGARRMNRTWSGEMAELSEEDLAVMGRYVWFVAVKDSNKG